MTTTMAREEYARICNNIFNLKMNGVSENDPVIVGLGEVAQQIADTYGFYTIDEDEDEDC